MELGICTGPPGRERARELRAAGCDYYEPMVASAIMREGSSAFGSSVDEWYASGLEAKCANVLFPASLKIVGPDASPEQLKAYLTEAMRRAELLGTERVVFGSGASRSIPEGFPRQEAHNQLKEALRLACALAGPGMLICLEHLRRAETNMVNRLAEAGAIVEELGLTNLALVVDGYHLAEENEDPSVLRQFEGTVAHVHVCGPGRRPPGQDDVGRMVALFEELAAAGYRGRCSLECNFSDLERDAPPALAAVREAARMAGLV
jgi:D-psicose/D-tagatose/L-ribulose 3-epimerase